MVMKGRLEDEHGGRIYERVKFRGLLNVVWHSLPLHAKLFLPYGLKAYRDILSQSSSLNELLEQHSAMYFTSNLYRALRPRHSIARRILSEDYEIR